MEIWKDVKGYEGIYLISSLGRVKSLERKEINTRGRLIGKKERILKFNTYKSGYRYYGLTRNKVLKSLKIHRLVAIAFIPNPENKPQVNHINGIKSDNSISNLEWCTQSENVRHAVATGLKQGSKGLENGMTKLTEKEVVEIRSIKGLSQYKIADLYSVSQTNVGRILRRELWGHI